VLKFLESFHNRMVDLGRLNKFARLANDMKADELFRNVPASIHELYLALAGLPKDMEVKADLETGVSEKTVDELRARTTWPRGLVITTPRKLHEFEWRSGVHGIRPLRRASLERLRDGLTRLLEG
jgi:hypothetical protein